jgi:hypothetical protein
MAFALSILDVEYAASHHYHNRNHTYQIHHANMLAADSLHDDVQDSLEEQQCKQHTYKERNFAYSCLDTFLRRAQETLLTNQDQTQLLW